MPDKAQPIQQHAQVNRLGTAKISKLMLEFAIPSIIGLVVNGLYNIIDSVFLGHAVGSSGLAVMTVAMPVMSFTMAIAVLIGTGANALIALRLGEGKHQDAEKVLGNAFTMTIITAVICTAGVFLLEDWVLKLSGATDEIWAESALFVRIISAGFLVSFFGMGFNNFIRTAGDPNRALYTMIAGTLCCIAANYLLVMILDWGVMGSAIATLFGQTVSAVLVFWYFVFSKKAPFKIRRMHFPLRANFVRLILILGSASFVIQLSGSVTQVLVNYQLVTLGASSPIGAEGALAALGVVNRIAFFVFFPVMGVAVAAQPLIGYNYGAKSYRRVIKTFQVALIWIMVIGASFWVVVHLIPEPIILLFGIEDSLLEFTTHALVVQLFMLPLFGLQMISLNYYQASGQPFKAMFISLTRQILYLIPLLFLMPVLFEKMSATLIALDGVYYAYPIADALSVITAAIFVAHEYKKLKAQIQLKQVACGIVVE